MCTLSSFRYSTCENGTAGTEDLYSLHSSLPKLKEQLDEQSGFDNLFDMEFSFTNGFQPVNYDRILSPPTDLQQAEELLGNSEMNPWRTKKLSHNANERQRRKKLNALYAQLRALLPYPNTRRKLSIPSTVCRVLTYIPELRCEIDKLGRHRDKLFRVKRSSHSSVITHKSRAIGQHSHDSLTCSPAIVSVNAGAMKRSAVVVTMYTCKAAFLLSTVLVFIEEEGLEVLDISTFVSRNRVCCNLHLQIIRRDRLDTEVLQEKMRLLCNTNSGNRHS